MNKEFFKRILSSFILIPLVLLFVIEGSIFFNFFILLILFITLYEWHYVSFKQIYYLPGSIFIFFSFYIFYLIRIEESLTIFLLILLTCVATDVGGYMFGKILKGPKLTKISPNKTYSGMFGGFLLSIILATIYLKNLTFLSLVEIDGQLRVKIMFIVLSTSFISQIGDLIISFCKRKSKIKNTGKIIPGHGGILDRIDGMIFAFPFVFLLIKIIQ